MKLLKRINYLLALICFTFSVNTQAQNYPTPKPVPTNPYPPGLPSPVQPVPPPGLKTDTMSIPPPSKPLPLDTIGRSPGRMVSPDTISTPVPRPK